MSEQQLWAVRLQSGEYLKGGASGPWVTATKDLAGAFANTVPGRTVVPVTLIETAELDALRAEVERLRADAERLDWLDTLNRVLNGHYGTSFGWKLVTNHNVNRLFLGHGHLAVDLHDSEGGAQKLPSCRAAIDAHRQTLCAALKGGEG